jgi:hypothetical protein
MAYYLLISRSAMQTLWFASAHDYIRELHPEYEFVFLVEGKALHDWEWPLEQAKKTQQNMIAIACAHARQRDFVKGLDIVIADESNEPRKHPAGMKYSAA